MYLVANDFRFDVRTLQVDEILTASFSYIKKKKNTTL